MTLLSFQSFGQTSELEKKSEFFIEIDPATFLFKGYGIHLRFKPKNSEHLLLGLGVYAMDFPDLLVGLNAKNSDQNWDVRLSQGYGLFGEYYFSEASRKWFLGTQISMQKYSIEKKEEQGDNEFTNALLMGYAGHTWNLFKDRFYIKPWAGLGYTRKVSGSNRLGGAEYDIAPITMFATLHVGYHF